MSLTPQTIGVIALVLIVSRYTKTADAETYAFLADLLYSTPSLEDAYPTAQSFYDALPPNVNVQELAESLACLANQASDDLRHLIFSIPCLIGDTYRPNHQQPPTPVPILFDNNSPIGIYLRQAMVNYSKLSFENVVTLLDNLDKWVTSTENITSQDYPKEPSSPRKQAYDLYERSLRSADVVLMKSSLRQFSDYNESNIDINDNINPLSSTNDNKQSSNNNNNNNNNNNLADRNKNNKNRHQYALLLLARVHLSQGEFTEAHYALREANMAAQSVSDHHCLEQIFNLQRRLNFFAPWKPTQKLYEDPPVLETAQPLAQPLASEESSWTTSATTTTENGSGGGYNSNRNSDNDKNDKQQNQKKLARVTTLGDRTKEILFDIRIALSRGEHIPDLFSILYTAYSTACSDPVAVQQSEFSATSSMNNSSSNNNNNSNNNINNSNKQEQRALIIPVETPYQAAENEAACHSVFAELWGVIQGGNGIQSMIPTSSQVQYTTLSSTENNILNSTSPADLHRILATQMYSTSSIYLENIDLDTSSKSHDELRHYQHTFTPTMAVDRMTMIASQVARLTFCGEFDQALLVLLQEIPPTRKTRMTHDEAQIWQKSVLGVWRQRAEQEDHKKLIEKLDKYTSPPLVLQKFVFEQNAKYPKDSEWSIRSLFDKVENLRNESQPALALSSLVEALEKCAQGGWIEMQLLGRIILAGVYADFNEPKQGLKELELIWPIILNKNARFKAMALWELARCKISLAIKLQDEQYEGGGTGHDEPMQSQDLLLLAGQHLEEAFNELMKLSDKKNIEKVLSNMAIVYDGLDDLEKRQQVIEKWQNVVEKNREVEETRIDQEIEDWIEWIYETLGVAAQVVTDE